MLTGILYLFSLLPSSPLTLNALSSTQKLENTDTNLHSLWVQVDGRNLGFGILSTLPCISLYPYRALGFALLVTLRGWV